MAAAARRTVSSGWLRAATTIGASTSSTPGFSTRRYQPDRPVALKRRSIPELLAEELRRLDEDDTYAATARRLVKLGSK